MIPINSATPAEFPNGKEHEVEFFADLIIKSCDKYSHFDLYDVVNKCQLEKEKQLQFNQIYFEVLNLLKSQKLIKNENGYQGVFRLTPEGKQAKDKGGYFKYMEYLKMKELEKEKPAIFAKNYIGGDNYGIQSSDIDLIKPATQTASKIIDTKPPKKSSLEIVSWVLASIAAILAIYEFIIKKL